VTQSFLLQVSIILVFAGLTAYYAAADERRLLDAIHSVVDWVLVRTTINFYYLYMGWSAGIYAINLVKHLLKGDLTATYVAFFPITMTVAHLFFVLIFSNDRVYKSRYDFDSIFIRIGVSAAIFTFNVETEVLPLSMEMAANAMNSILLYVSYYGEDDERIRRKREALERDAAERFAEYVTGGHR
jgi:hypothetical protein